MASTSSSSEISTGSEEDLVVKDNFRFIDKACAQVQHAGEFKCARRSSLVHSNQPVESKRVTC